MLGLFLHCEAIYVHCIWVLSVHVCVHVSGCCMVLSFQEVYSFVSGFDLLDLVPLVINPGGLGVPSGDVSGYLFQGIILSRMLGFNPSMKY